jgi:hypothetical protein
MPTIVACSFHEVIPSPQQPIATLGCGRQGRIFDKRQGRGRRMSSRYPKNIMTQLAAGDRHGKRQWGNISIVA